MGVQERASIKGRTCRRALTTSRRGNRASVFLPTDRGWPVLDRPTLPRSPRIDAVVHRVGMVVGSERATDPWASRPCLPWLRRAMGGDVVPGPAGGMIQGVGGAGVHS